MLYAVVKANMIARLKLICHTATMVVAVVVVHLPKFYPEYHSNEIENETCTVSFINVQFETGLAVASQYPVLVTMLPACVPSPTAVP